MRPSRQLRERAKYSHVPKYVSYPPPITKVGPWVQVLTGYERVRKPKHSRA